MGSTKQKKEATEALLAPPTLTNGCLKVHRGKPILLCIFVDPLDQLSGF